MGFSKIPLHILLTVLLKYIILKSVNFFVKTVLSRKTGFRAKNQTKMKTLKYIVTALVVLLVVFVSYHKTQAQEQEKTVISAEEAKAKILAGKCLEGVIIKDKLVFDGMEGFRLIALEKGFCLKNVRLMDGLFVSGSTPTVVYFENVTIKGDLAFNNIEVISFVLNDVWLEGDLEFIETVINGLFRLSFTKAPEKIFVNKKNAQLIHWAAPTVPLVIMPNKE